MKETVLIECPHCNKNQIEDIYDLVDTGDQEGKFNMNCNECKKEFIVEFLFVSHVGTKPVNNM